MRVELVASVVNSEIPQVSAAETVDEIVAVSKRKVDFPLRREFLQRTEGGVVIPGPLSLLVKAGDSRALLLYLLLLTKASAPPWDAALPATVWARALGFPLPDTKTARSTISKTWLRLERHGLVKRVRSERLADVFLLCEDGSGIEYTNPGEVGDLYFRVPLALWQEGPDESRRWYQVLTLPELALVLIGRSLGDAFRLPFEMGPSWYGISGDTINRGVQGLKDKSLMNVDKRYKKAPLSAVGYTAEHVYTLQAPFGPVGHLSGRSRKISGRSRKNALERRGDATSRPVKARTPRRSSLSS